MSKTPFISEAELIQKCKQGNLKHQEKLYKHFYGYAMAVGLRYLNDRDDALEVINDSFIKIFKLFSSVLWTLLEIFTSIGIGIPFLR